MDKIVVLITTESGELLERVVLVTQHNKPVELAAFIANDLTDRFESEPEREIADVAHAAVLRALEGGLPRGGKP